MSSYYLSTHVTLMNSNSCTQYIHGLIDDNDLEIFRRYSSLVTEFILTDVGVEKPIIATSTFFHIAQFLEPSSGLLPSLLRLRISQTDHYFPCLHLLYTPSLRTLEADVQDHQHQIFFSFLTTLAHKAPLLEEIILGPSKFPLKSLQVILRFTHLRRLELRDVALTIDITFLQDVGTLLNLESFILDARSCTYIERIPEEQPCKTPPAEQAEVGSKMPQPSSDVDDNPIYENTTEVRNETLKRSSDIDNDRPLVAYASSSRPSSSANEDKVNHPLPPNYNQIPCNKDSSISAVGGFYQLKKFHFVGELSLLQDMILYIASSTLEDISITVIHLDSYQEAEKSRRRALYKETQLEIVAMEKATRIAYSNSDNKFRVPLSSNLSSKRQAILEKAETRWKEEEARYVGIRHEVADSESVQKSQKYTTILQTVSSRWSADLKTVKFNNLDKSESSRTLPTLPVLPKLVYEPLFCHAKLEILEFKQWKIDSVEDFLLSMKSSCPKNLKQLRLPVHDADSAISLSGLLDIAEACPMLESLHCSIDTRPPIPEYSVPTTKALSHGLQSLFVDNDPTSLWDFDQLLLVARHLYLTFPGLQTIAGPNAEQWVRIRELVKIFQVIRQDDVYRF